MWFVNNQNVLYQGHVLSLKCSKRSNNATFWKHDENQDEGDNVLMTIYEFLVDYMLLMTCKYLKLLFNLVYAYICEPSTCIVIFWHDNIEWYNNCSKESINRPFFFLRSRIPYDHSKCSLWNAGTFDILIQISCIRCHSATFF